MNLYSELNLQPSLHEPYAWISRVVIFKQLSPEPVVIRDIPLKRGLNLIWAEESAEGDLEAEITGHSAGKTTFCRLLRYLLGEKTFGTKTVMGLIRKALPDGYVAAEVHVQGQQWVVRRPIGGGRLSYIMKDATIERLLKEHGNRATEEGYTQEIGLEQLIDKLETNEVSQTGERIQWAHVLEWCTRDQEARFQNIYDWRSPRSDSEAPTFRFPKAGPLFTMRAVLGLFLPDELTGEGRLSSLLRAKEKISKEIEEKKREPQFRVNLYDEKLRKRLKIVYPNETDLDSRPFRSDELLTESIERLAAKASAQIEGDLRSYNTEMDALQIQIDDLGAEIRQLVAELEKRDSVYSINSKAAEEVVAGLSKNKEQRQSIEVHKDQQCKLGGVFIQDCLHVQARQRKLTEITDLQDSHALEQAEAQRVEENKRIQEESKSIENSIDKLKQERGDVLRRRDGLRAMAYEKQEELRDLQISTNELASWTSKLEQSDGYEDLKYLRKELADTESEIAKTEKELNESLTHHSENRKLLNSVFSAAVRSVLPAGNYNGVVSLDNREPEFHITHGPAMSGEAVETLSVLLSDVSCLIYNTISDKACLPGFLLHDSPREADLEIGIYRRFMRFAASLQGHFSSLDECPYQYIITTTTAPPTELQADEYLKLRLNAASEDGLLLKVNIAKQSASLLDEPAQGQRG